VGSVVVAGCADLKSAPGGGDDGGVGDAGAVGDGAALGDGGGVGSGDGGAVGDGDGGVLGGGDGGGGNDAGPRPDAGPSLACRPMPPDCLDATPANVIDVPGEATLGAALGSAKAGDTVQIHGGAVPAGTKVPAGVTMHGCQGAQITGTVSFAGSNGTIEGFDVPGSIVANQTGQFSVRWNRFTGTSTTEGISARSIDSLVNASVSIVVDSNAFTGRPRGVVADTAYDTGTHEVTITLQNNVFTGVANPLIVTQSGLVGKITPKVLFNTFYGFDKALQLFGVTTGTVPTTGNVFANGNAAIDANCMFSVDYSLSFQVATNTPQQAPLSGSFTAGDPKLVAPATGDLHLGGTSAALDQVPGGTTVPSTDYFGCPRPRAYTGADPKSDLGAIEMQP
jgi:hypothetical protein